jgi:ArsR family metal-binding transcriptional regulator
MVLRIMLLSGYKKEIFKPQMNPQFESFHCIAHLENDISEVIPYLNAVLGGTSYQKSPPSVMFHVNGRLIAVHSKKIAINALKDEEEAEKILQWLMREINETWEKRDDIEPSEKTAEKPKLMEVLKRLPKTNCGECGQPTCMVFSSLVIQGIKGPEQCPPLDEVNRRNLEKYLSQFHFIDI